MTTHTHRQLALAALVIGIGLTNPAALEPPPDQTAHLPVPEEQSNDTVQTIRDQLAALTAEQELVGLSAGIIRNGELLTTLHFGYEDLEREIKTTPETMYRWASISKSLTAVVAMQLVEDGRLDLDADIRALLPEFPEKRWSITARQLLCHQGGVVHYSNGEVIRAEREYEVEHPFADTVVSLDTFAPSPLVCEPGTKYSYTTHGYMLLGAVVQRAGEAAFATQVADRLCTPLGLRTLQPDYEWVEIAHRAKGYRRFGEGLAPFSPPSADVSWKLPGGGFISTVGDLGHFAAALLRDDVLVSPATREKMWTRQRTQSGGATSYGLGFSVGRRDADRGVRFIGHSGSQQKARTRMLICPETGDGIVLMSNSEWAQLGEAARQALNVLVDATRESQGQ